MNTAETTTTAATPTAPAKPGRMSVINLEKFRNTVLFSITIRRWGNSAIVRDMDKLEQYMQLRKQEAQEGTTPSLDNGGRIDPVKYIATDRVKSTKKLIQSPNYDKLHRAMTALKKRSEQLSMPSFIKSGMFIVRADKVADVDATLKNGWANIAKMELAEFVDNYPLDIMNARTARVKDGGLGPLFDESEYPDADSLQEKFSVDWFWTALSVPENIPDALREEANQKFKKRMEDAAEQIELALRQNLLELIAHAEERLSPTATGEPKVFRDSMIGNLKEFLETFDNRDMFGDIALREIVNKARAVIINPDGSDRVNLKTIRSMANVREQARKEFAAIKEQLSGLVEETGRALDLSED